MKIIIASPGYPSEINLYSYMFVHARAKSYNELGHEVAIVKFHHIQDSRSYVYEGITVLESANLSFITSNINFEPDCLAVHSPKGKGLAIIPQILSHYQINSVTWIHLEEAINMWRRWFELNTFRKLLRFAAKGQFGNLLALYKLRKFLKAEDKKGNKVVFVSNWLKRVVKKDLMLSIKNSVVIPNPINTKTFTYQQKGPKKLNRILMIRSFSTRKYATDIAVKIINKLNRESNDFRIDIYGDGEYFEKDIKMIKDQSNINIYRKFLNHADMNNVMQEYGFLLIPTRQDSHGVTMCEAMSAGLIAIVNKNSAIPEYLDNSKGILFNSINEAVERIIDLANDVEKFRIVSKNAATYVEQTISSEVIAKKELETLQSAAK